MRELADADRIQRVLAGLGEAARVPGRVYLTGGATAVLLGWRKSTIDVDLAFVPDQDTILRAIPALKEQLQVNVELASPADFIPVPRGWEDRSLFVDQTGVLGIFHFDPYAQALAKLERGHQQDITDVRELVARGFVKPSRALEYFSRIEPELYRFPAIHAPSYRHAVASFFGELDG